MGKRADMVAGLATGGCGGCGHTINQHSTGECDLLGCECEGWRNPRVVVIDEEERLVWMAFGLGVAMVICILVAVLGMWLGRGML